MADQPSTSPVHKHLSRRSLAVGGAWAVPSIAVATAAPAFASSPTMVPGINGWMTVETNKSGCSYSLSLRDTGTGDTPDGSPWGLYIYDVEKMNVFSNAQLVYWILGDHRNASYPITWTNMTGHSGCWSAPTVGAPQTKVDGFIYTPYTFKYTCDLWESDPVSDGSHTRLFLKPFRVKATFTQPVTAGRCDVSYWAQRYITIDPDGAGYRPPVIHTFERRAGALGPYVPSPRARSASTNSASSVMTPQAL